MFVAVWIATPLGPWVLAGVGSWVAEVREKRGSAIAGRSHPLRWILCKLTSTPFPLLPIPFFGLYPLSLGRKWTVKSILFISSFLVWSHLKILIHVLFPSLESWPSLKSSMQVTNVEFLLWFYKDVL